MKKLLALAIVLALGGCVSIPGVTSSVNNPITIDTLYKTESSLTVVVAGLNGYRSLCVAKQIPQTCRGVIVKLQSYTKPAAVYLKTARGFVKDNDQVNAIVAYNTAVAFLRDAQQIALENGVGK